MTKSEFRAAYREARKLARFIDTFHDRLKHLPAEKRTYPASSVFSFTRLHGDHLSRHTWFPRVLAEHRSLFACLRVERPVRLPA